MPLPRSTLLVSAFAFMTVVYGCTQDFGQFEPGDGSGASGPGSGGGPGSGAGPGTGGSESCDGDSDCADSNPCTAEGLRGRRLRLHQGPGWPGGRRRAR